MGSIFKYRSNIFALATILLPIFAMLVTSLVFKPSRLITYLLTLSVMFASLGTGFVFIYFKPKVSLLRPKFFSYYAAIMISMAFILLPYSFLSGLTYMTILLGSLHSYTGLIYFMRVTKLRVPAVLSFITGLLGMLTFLKIALYPQNFVQTKQFLTWFHLLPLGFHGACLFFFAKNKQYSRLLGSNLMTSRSIALASISTYFLIGEQRIQILLAGLLSYYLIEASQYYSLSPKKQRGERGRVKPKPIVLCPPFALSDLITEFKSSRPFLNIACSSGSPNDKISANRTIFLSLLKEMVGIQSNKALKIALHHHQTFQKGLVCDCIDLQFFSEDQKALRDMTKNFKKVQGLAKSIGWKCCFEKIPDGPAFLSVNFCQSSALPENVHIFPVHKNKKREKVLVVDDDSSLTELYEEALSSRYEVIIAGDGNTALEQFKKHRPRKVVTDLMLPKLNGLDLISSIKTLAPATQIVSVSGVYDKELLKQSELRGSQVVLSKPLSLVDLERQLDAA